MFLMRSRAQRNSTESERHSGIHQKSLLIRFIEHKYISYDILPYGLDYVLHLQKGYRKMVSLMMRFKLGHTLFIFKGGVQCFKKNQIDTLSKTSGVVDQAMVCSNFTFFI